MGYLLKTNLRMDGCPHRIPASIELTGISYWEVGYIIHRDHGWQRQSMPSFLPALALFQHTECQQVGSMKVSSGLTFPLSFNQGCMESSATCSCALSRLGKRWWTRALITNTKGALRASWQATPLEILCSSIWKLCLLTHYFHKEQYLTSVCLGFSHKQEHDIYVVN